MISSQPIYGPNGVKLERENSEFTMIAKFWAWENPAGRSFPRETQKEKMTRIEYMEIQHLKVIIIRKK